MTDRDESRLNLYWGDAHTQFRSARDTQFTRDGAPEWRGFVEQALRFAAGRLDVFPVIYYPAFDYCMPGGLRNESVGMQDGLVEEWGAIQELTAEHLDPGRLVTYPGYEWTGDRLRWGDHNVIYPTEGGPLDLSSRVDDLFRTVRARGGIAIPHHTGYQVGARGKDWTHHDPAVSPLAEVFSVHGSSEAIDAPRDMRGNGYMSPRVTGGTIADGLAAGCRFGLIGSGDNGGGFPGRWGTGLFGIWARELTREAVWEALLARRVYAVTGDRMRLSFGAHGHAMGEAFAHDGPVTLDGEVVACDAVDRIELVRDGAVVDTYCHNGRWRVPDAGKLRVKLRLEFGWGPTAMWGVRVAEHLWRGRLETTGAAVAGAEGAFTYGPQQLASRPDRVEWEIRTRPRVGPAAGDCQQAVIVELEGEPTSRVAVVDGPLRHEATLHELCLGSTVLADLPGVRRTFAEQFGLTEFDNAETIRTINAHKLLVHRAAPEPAYRVPFSFADDPPRRPCSYYVRVSQLNGQMAWSSPVWVEAARPK